MQCRFSRKKKSKEIVPPNTKVFNAHFLSFLSYQEATESTKILFPLSFVTVGFGCPRGFWEKRNKMTCFHFQVEGNCGNLIVADKTAIPLNWFGPKNVELIIILFFPRYCSLFSVLIQAIFFFAFFDSQSFRKSNS